MSQTREIKSLLLLAAFPTRKSSVVEIFLVLEGGNLKPKNRRPLPTPNKRHSSETNRESGVATAVFSGDRLQKGGARCSNLEVHPLLRVAPAVAALQPPEVLRQLQNVVPIRGEVHPAVVRQAVRVRHLPRRAERLGAGRTTLARKRATRVPTKYSRKQSACIKKTWDANPSVWRSR